MGPSVFLPQLLKIPKQNNNKKKWMRALTGACFEMPPGEIEEKAPAVYAKKVHKGGFDDVNRVISK